MPTEKRFLKKYNYGKSHYIVVFFSVTVEEILILKLLF